MVSRDNYPVFLILLLFLIARKRVNDNTKKGKVKTNIVRFRLIKAMNISINMIRLSKVTPNQINLKAGIFMEQDTINKNCPKKGKTMNGCANSSG